MAFPTAVGVSHFVKVAGRQIHYRSFNSTEVEKPGLLFIHGMWAHSHWWDHIVPFYLDRFRVIAMDLGGMGDSDKAEHYSGKGYGHEVLAVLKDAGFSRATVIAHSFGGTPALFACHLDPSAISHLILVDSRLAVPGMPAPTAEQRRMSKFMRRVYESPEIAIDRYRLIPPGAPVAPELLARIARYGLREESGGWTWKFDINVDPELTDDPKRVIPGDIMTPIDYIYGEKSGVVDPEMVELITAFLGTCGEPRMLQGAYHHIVLEHPELLVEALDEVIMVRMA
jgi:Predicted hydrolases or acyltransferases (alpha/beta hydrolase superfamily)